jgi:hypothetical protein
MAITEYIQNVDCAILNTVFENTVRSVNKCQETGRGHFEHYLQLSVIIRCTESFWSPCICIRWCKDCVCGDVHSKHTISVHSENVNTIPLWSVYRLHTTCSMHVTFWNVQLIQPMCYEAANYDASIWTLFSGLTCITCLTFTFRKRRITLFTQAENNAPPPPQLHNGFSWKSIRIPRVQSDGF